MKKVLYFVLALVLIIGMFFLFRNTETPEQRTVRIEQLRHEAYDYAVSCSGTKTPELSFEQIMWITVPGSSLKINAQDGNIELAGFFSPPDSAIYVPETNDDVFWILAHESMHGIGFRGHPDSPFRTCNLLPEQH